VIADAAAGRDPRVVLVTGPSRIGKSAPLAEAARRADVPVLAAQAFAPDRDEARSLAGRLLRQVGARVWDLSTVITAPETGALCEVVPGLARVPGSAAGVLDEETRRAFDLQGAVGLVAAVARPRCLIVADDLQCADPTSLTLLGLLLRRLDAVSLAAAYRRALTSLRRSACRPPRQPASRSGRYRPVSSGACSATSRWPRPLSGRPAAPRSPSPKSSPPWPGKGQLPRAWP
jgi:AAA ATPase domain